MKLLPYKYTMSLGEAFQANDMKFSFVNPVEENFQMIHAWVQCREYFNELLMKNHHPENFQFVTTYGFDYKHEEFPLDMSATRLAVRFMNAEQKKTFMENLQWIHAVETANDVDLTTIHDIGYNDIVVVTSKMWIQKCLLTNIYTLLLKLAALDVSKHNVKSLFEIKGKQNSIPSEISYVNTLTVPVFNSLLENCTLIAQLPSKYVDGSESLRGAGTVHANSGIMYLKQCMKAALATNPLKELVRGLKTVFQGNYKTAFIKEVV